MSVRFLKLCIAFSLLANMLLLGISFGHMGRSLVGLECKPTQRSHHINVHELFAVLPSDKQNQLQQDIAHYDHDEKQLADRLTEERKKMIGLIQAKPFDKAAYLSQVKVMDDVHAQNAANIAGMVAEIAQQCDDEQRAELTAKLNGMLLDKQEHKPGE